MRTAETVIIGAGVVGASVACHLSERGMTDIIWIDSSPVQGCGSTGAATGGIRAQFETDINIRLSLYSLDFFRNWDRPCGYDPKGYLFFATTREQLEYLELNVENQRRLGVKDVDIVDAAAIAEMVPGMNCRDILGGSFGCSDGFIDPLAVMRGFTEKAADHGVRPEFSTAAVGLKCSGDSIVGVETDPGRISCRNVVLCTGAVAKELAATAGVDLPVDPQRRQIIWARTRSTLPAHLPMVIDIGTGFHFRPAKDFRDTAYVSDGHDILFAYPDPAEPVSAVTAFDPAFIELVYEKAKHRAGFLYDSEPVREKCRAGLYENTPDHHAILGGCDVSGLYLANGFSGHGVMHSPATGRALAEIMLDGGCRSLDVSQLSLKRFAEGRQLHETAFI